MSIVNDPQQRQAALNTLARLQNELVDLQDLLDVAVRSASTRTARMLLAECDVHLENARHELDAAALRLVRLP